MGENFSIGVLTFFGFDRCDMQGVRNLAWHASNEKLGVAWNVRKTRRRMCGKLGVHFRKIEDYWCMIASTLQTGLWNGMRLANYFLTDILTTT